MSFHIPISESELVERLQSGDTTAVSILYEKYAPALYGFIVRIVHCGKCAEEVLQDCFVKTWKSIGNYDSENGKLFSWILTIARSSARDLIPPSPLANCQCTCIGGGDAIKDAAYSTFNTERKGMEQRNNMLSPEEKDVMELLFVQGLTQADAAEKLNIPMQAVMTITRSAISKLSSL